MNTTIIPNGASSRRDFLARVGQGALLTALGAGATRELGLAGAFAGEPGDRLTFGPLEPLVQLMTETPAGQLLPRVVGRLQAGEPLRRVVAAAALANARRFGGEDYVGYHTLMALGPAFHMSEELPSESRALPVLKVVYRNTERIQARGGTAGDVLRPVAGVEDAGRGAGGEILRDAVRRRDLDGAERVFAGLSQGSPDEVLNDLLLTVEDHAEVHRVVLPYRAWDLVGIIGAEHAHTLLRQSVHYCVQAESWSRSPAAQEPRSLIPALLEQHRLLDPAPAPAPVADDDRWLDEFSQNLFTAEPGSAAALVARALAEGRSLESIGQAITLAANQLVLRDHGRTPRDEVPGKPIGSVHGDSIGVHACDSANAWRNLARVGQRRNACACLILGGWQVAYDRVARGGDFLNWQPLPIDRHLDEIRTSDPGEILAGVDEAIRGNLQGRAAALVHRYGDLGHSPRPVFDLLLKYAVSEDGSLHAEKFYRTASEEFLAGRPAFRWRHLVALARVTASEFGRPAAGMAEARELLGLA